MNGSLIIAVSPVSRTMDKGFSSNGIWTNTIEIEYEGEVTNFNNALYGYGVDERGGVGSLVFLTIEFEDKPSHQKPMDCSFPSIGWLEVNPMGHIRPDSKNPILFNMRINLHKTDFQDLMLLGNDEIQIETAFNWGGDKKLLTYQSDELVQFHISRVEIKPIQLK